MRRLLLALVLASFAQASLAAAYTYRSTGTVATNTNGAALNPGSPAGLQVGDLMILATCSRLDTAGGAAEDTGWTNIFQDNDGQTPDVEVWARVADGGADDAATVDWAGADDSTAQISAYSGDVHTNLATIVAHFDHNTQGAIASDLPLDALTITTADTLVFLYACKSKTATSDDATTITAPTGGGTKRFQVIGPAGNSFFAAAADFQQTTAVNWDGSNFTRNGTDQTANNSGVVLSLLTDAGAAPTFTAGPTAGTKTQTTVPFTFTSSATGTVKGVACPNGQASPTVAQVIAGNCTGDIAAVATISEAVVATVGDAGTFTGLTANTTYDTHFAIDAAADSAAISSVADQTTIAVPTFTAGPMAGTITSTTIPVTFTSDQTGDVKGVACPDGQTFPTVTQVLAGNCTGNIAAQSAFTEAVVATVGDGETFTGLSPSTTYDTHYAQTNAAGNSAAISTLANQTTSAGGAGVFTVNPTVTAQDTNDYTISGTTGAAVAVSAVACAKDSTAPTIAQVVAADCTGNVNALAAVSESWNGADSFVLGGALTFPVYDVYVTDGTTRINLVDEFLDVPAGKQRIDGGLTSVHATSPYFGLGVVANDIPTCDATTDPNLYVITDDADGTISFEAGGDTSRQLVECDVYDLSAATMLAFLFVFNNHPPEILGDGSLFQGEVYRIGVNPGVDLSTLVQDPELDDVDFSVISGALPDDWVLNAETGVISDGTPGDCDDYDVEIRLTDSYGSTNDVSDTVTVGDVLPNPAGMTPSEYAAALAADFCVP